MSGGRLTTGIHRLESRPRQAIEESLQPTCRGHIWCVRTGPHLGELKLLETVADECLGEFGCEATVPMLRRNPVKQLQLRWCMEIPEASEADELLSLVKPCTPQAVPVRGEEAEALRDKRGGPLAGYYLVVPEVPPHLVRAPEGVQLVHVRLGKRAEAQSRRLDFVRPHILFHRKLTGRTLLGCIN